MGRWRRHFRPELFHIYFFDDLQSEPSALRRSIINFLGGDPEKSNGRVRVEQKINETVEKLPLNDDVRSAVARFFEQELKKCAAEFGGPAVKWPAQYGFAL